jgi:hypothetical protein
VFNYCASCALLKRGGSLKRSLGMVRGSLFEAQLLITIGINCSKPQSNSSVDEIDCYGDLFVSALKFSDSLFLPPKTKIE